MKNYSTKGNHHLAHGVLISAAVFAASSLSAGASTPDEEMPYAGITMAAFFENCLDNSYDFDSWPLPPPSKDARRMQPGEAVKLLPDGLLSGDAWDIVRTIDGPYLFSVSVYVTRENALSHSGGCTLHSSYIDYRMVYDFFKSATVPLSENVRESDMGETAGTDMILQFDDTKWHLSFVYSKSEPTTFAITSHRVLESFEER